MCANVSNLPCNHGLAAAAPWRGCGAGRVLLASMNVAHGRSAGNGRDDYRKWVRFVAGHRTAGNDPDSRAKNGIAEPMAIRR